MDYIDEMHSIERDYNQRYSSCGETAWRLAQSEFRLRFPESVCKCGVDIDPRRLDAGYRICTSCSDLQTKPTMALWSEDSDGNVHLRCAHNVSDRESVYP